MASRLADFFIAGVLISEDNFTSTAILTLCRAISPDGLVSISTMSVHTTVNFSSVSNFPSFFPVLSNSCSDHRQVYKGIHPLVAGHCQH